MTEPPIIDPTEALPTGAPEEIEPVQDDDGGGRKSAASALVNLAEQRFDFEVSPDGEAFAVPRTGPRVVAVLRGGRQSLRALLARAYFQTTGKVVPQQALSDALMVLDGAAQEEDPTELHTRVARIDGTTWIDMGDTTGRAIRLDRHGWSVENDPPVRFRRSSTTGPMVSPTTGGSLDDLWRFLNVAEPDRPGVIAWLVSALYPDFPHPVLALSGEQGAGKTSAAKVLVSLVDPSPVPTRKPPRDADSWVTAAAGSWVVALDNVANIGDWLSDSLCRACTGEGDVRRRLYTDGDLAVIAFRRCIILTGIDYGAVAGDLADRLLPVQLDPIPEGDRLPEDGDEAEPGFWQVWDQVRPGVLGALLDLAASQASLAAGGSLLPPTKRPRMLDFAMVLARVDRILGTDGIGRYLAKQGDTAAEALTADPFVQAVAAVGRFEGTASQLLDLVEAPARIPKGWPANARTVTQRLRRQGPPMRKAGWTVEDDGAANKSHATVWTITPPEIAGIPTSPNSPTSPTTGEASQASQASHEYGQSQDDGSAAALVLSAWPGTVVDDEDPHGTSEVAS